MEDVINYIEEYLDELTNSLGVRTSLQIDFNDHEDGSIYKISLRGDRLNFLIGHHGDSLEGLQHLLSLAVFNEFDEWHRLVVDINNYRQKRLEKLEDIAKKSIDKARFFKEDVHLPAMNAYDRKQIHEFIGGYDDVESSSEGEGFDRHIVLRFLS